MRASPRMDVHVRQSPWRPRANCIPFRPVSWLSVILLPRLPVCSTVTWCGFVPTTVAGPLQIRTGFPTHRNVLLFGSCRLYPHVAPLRRGKALFMVFVSHDTPYIWYSVGDMMRTNNRPGGRRFIGRPSPEDSTQGGRQWQGLRSALRNCMKGASFSTPTMTFCPLSWTRGGRDETGSWRRTTCRPSGRDGWTV